MLSAGDLRAAKALDEQMRGDVDHARWLELNARFHRLLYAPSGAETTLELIDQLRARGERYVRLWSHGPGIHRPLEAGEEHTAIVALCESGDAAGARAAIERHIHHTRDRLLAHGTAREAAAAAAADGAV